MQRNCDAGNYWSTPIQEALTSRREDIEARTLSSLQKLMSEYRAGMLVSMRAPCCPATKK